MAPQTYRRRWLQLAGQSLMLFKSAEARVVVLRIRY